MATNKNALIRYRTIDTCLQNRSRSWTLEDLIAACSDALYELEGKDAYVSKRTVQLDLQFMRSDKLGYNAPIVVYDRKYYTYGEEGYSITNIPLTHTDMDILTESVEMLRQFKDFSLFSELNGVIQKLEDKIYRESNSHPAIIHMEKNEHLKGLQHLDTLYQAILKKIVLRIQYQSFKAPEPQEFLFHGYILKEFNNRWFLVGKRAEEEKILTLALDRILKIDLDLSTTYQVGNFDADLYYKDTYGVTVLPADHVIDILMTVDRYNAPYVITKPFHPSQQVEERYEDGSARISLRVHHNFEIERLILGFGASIEILEPPKLRERMIMTFEKALERYGGEEVEEVK